MNILSWLLQRFGFVGALVMSTVLSVIASEAITLSLTLFFTKRLSAFALVMAFLVPVIVAPLFSAATLRLMINLETIRQELYRLSITNDLTGAYNRRYFTIQARLEFERARRYGIPFGMLLFDLDDFKSVNDHYGHAVGDAVLQTVTSRCQASSRKNDTFARLGGDEFVFALPECETGHALRFAERVRSLLLDEPIKLGGQEVSISMSVGVVCYQQANASFEAILHAADQALYASKNAGKNRVVLAPLETPLA